MFFDVFTQKIAKKLSFFSKKNKSDKFLINLIQFDYKDE